VGTAREVRAFAHPTILRDDGVVVVAQPPFRFAENAFAARASAIVRALAALSRMRHDRRQQQ
jgi:hypothetical protein